MKLKAVLNTMDLGGGIPEESIDRLESLLERGATLIELIKDKTLSIPASTLGEMVDAHRRLVSWRVDTADLRERIPRELIEQAFEPHQRTALDRAVSSLPEARWADGLALWDRCFALCRKEGTVTAEGKPGQGYDEHLLRREGIEELAAHRWLRMRRGEREGVLRLIFALPRSSFREQAELLEFGSAQLETLILRPIEDALRGHLDDWAEREAIRAARNTFAGVLSAPPLETFPALCIHIGRSLGAAVIDAKGQLRHGHIAKRAEELEALAQRQQVRAVVLPTRAFDADMLRRLQKSLGHGRAVVQVSPAGLSEAREGISSPRPIASALVLGWRAIRPLEEWSRLDPVRLGLAEFQSDLDEEQLRAALRETRDIARLEKTRVVAPQIAAPSLGLGVKSVDELRPGLMVQGVVTSLTPFGAFVNIGLDQEGLVHVSEMADRFVKDPAEVVRIGQRVMVRVLSFDKERGRISLSLRREDHPRPRSSASSARSKALGDLDKLFKK